jgi:heptosyltransferase-2
MNQLIIAPSWLGDIIMSQSLLIAIKKQVPEANIDILASSWSHPLLQLMPEVNSTIEFNVKHGELALGYRRNIAKILREKNYEKCYILPNSFKSALVPWIAKIPDRIGWRGEFRYGLLTDCRLLNKSQIPLMANRYAALAYPIEKSLQIQADSPRISLDKQQITSLLATFNLEYQVPTLAICPGAAFGSAKQWPAEYHARVIEYALQQSWQVIILGSKQDIAISEMIKNNLAAKYLNKVNDLTGKTSLMQVIASIALADTIISNDSGLMHLAASLNKSQIAIYGSTSVLHAPPMNSLAESLHIEIDCRPCNKRVCPLKHHRCMRQIHPSMVIKKLKKIING